MTHFYILEKSISLRCTLNILTIFQAVCIVFSSTIKLSQIQQDLSQSLLHSVYSSQHQLITLKQIRIVCIKCMMQHICAKTAKCSFEHQTFTVQSYFISISTVIIQPCCYVHLLHNSASYVLWENVYSSSCTVPYARLLHNSKIFIDNRYHALSWSSLQYERYSRKMILFRFVYDFSIFAQVQNRSCSS